MGVTGLASPAMACWMVAPARGTADNQLMNGTWVEVSQVLTRVNDVTGPKFDLVPYIGELVRHLKPSEQEVLVLYIQREGILVEN